MARKRHTAEEIINHLRRAEVELGQARERPRSGQPLATLAQGPIPARRRGGRPVNRQARHLAGLLQ